MPRIDLNCNCGGMLMAWVSLPEDKLAIEGAFGGAHNTPACGDTWTTPAKAITAHTRRVVKPVIATVESSLDRIEAAVGRAMEATK